MSLRIDNLRTRTKPIAGMIGASLGFILMSAFLVVPASADDDDENGLTTKVVQVNPTGYKAAEKSAKSEEGERLFKNLNCMACHTVRNAGGTMGPMLDGIGGRRSAEFIGARISRSPEAISEHKKLVGRNAVFDDHVRISPDKADKICQYLLTIPEPPGGFVVVSHFTRLPADEPPATNQQYKPKAPTPSSEKGKRLYLNQGCIACHSIADVGGWLGPRLDGVGGRRSREYIIAHITSPSVQAIDTDSALRKKSWMPPTKLPTIQVNQIVDFLMTLPPQKNK